MIATISVFGNGSLEGNRYRFSGSDPWQDTGGPANGLVCDKDIPTGAENKFYTGFSCPVPPGSTILSGTYIVEFDPILKLFNGDWLLNIPYSTTAKVDTSTPTTIFDFLVAAPQQNSTSVTANTSDNIQSFDCTDAVQAFVNAINYLKNDKLMILGLDDDVLSTQAILGDSVAVQKPQLLVEYTSNGRNVHRKQLGTALV